MGNPATINELAAKSATSSAEPSEPRGRDRVSAKYIWLLILATFGSYIALVAPIGISLALRIQDIDPDHVERLGFVTGAGALVAALSGPLVGMWSDRTRSRFGRRRPFAFCGIILGFCGLAITAWAPTVPLLIVAWMFTQAGLATAMGSLLFSQADRLPEEQRGKVAGLSGFVQMIASVAGTGLASGFVGNNYLVFLVPGAVGLVLMLLWVALIKEPDSRNSPLANPITLKFALSQMVFSPREYPDFAWNWLGRLLFNFGVTFATSFTTLFFASRLTDSGDVADLGGLIVALALVGVLFTAGGALLGGFLSDKLNRRRIFIAVAGVVFTVGAIILAAGGENLPILISGASLINLALGVFSAVDQAIVLDVLPNADSEAGRYLGVNGYSTTLAQSFAPMLAAPLLVLGATGSDKNYGLLFIIAAACTLIGGTIVMLFVRKSN